MKKQKYNVIDLFCGAGGLSFGFEQAGCNILLGIDNDELALKTFEKNHKNAKSLCCDITKINYENTIKEIIGNKKIDLIIGGPPCQSFSIVAQNPKRLGIKDERGLLFFEMCRILKDKKPKAFIAENVKGILSANKGESFPLIIKEFEKSGYSINYKLINSANYGVPQKRERVIIVGIRKDLKKRFEFKPEPINSSNDFVPLKKVIEKKVEDKYFFSEKAVEGMKRAKKDMNKGRAQDIEKPCNTVGSHLAKVSLNSTDPVLLIKNRYRRFTPREVARIQSFPEEYKLSLSDSVQYRALGNAIAPLVIWHIAKNLLELLTS